MVYLSVLEEPLVDGNDRIRSWQLSQILCMGLAATAVAVTVLAGFYLMEPFLSGRGVFVPAESTLNQASTTPIELFKMYERPISVKEINEFLRRLPAHDMEDLVFQHIKPHAEHVFHNFLEHFGSTAPHFKTGERFERRHKLQDKGEFSYRLGIFESFLRDVIRLNNFETRHNLRPDRAVFGVTKFADWTFDEFKTLLKGPANKLNTTTQASSKTFTAKSDLKQTVERPVPPCTKNWAAEYPFLFEARDQKGCGACYGYAAAEVMRSAAFLNTGIDQGPLSVQFVVDCKGDGCGGGDAGDVMNWIHFKGGIPRKVDYGPDDSHSVSCKSGVAKALTTTGAERFYDEQKTANKLCGSGPLTMGVYASDAWQAYVSGVLSHHSCSSTHPNHDTQVVGVFEDNAAFLVRNSWGNDWGVNATTLEPGPDAGFILLEYGYNTCDNTDCNSFPKNVSCLGDCNDHPAPAPPAPMPPGWRCSNTCEYSTDGWCDDGGPGSSDSSCRYGTDCDDCGNRPPRPTLAHPTPTPAGSLCSDTCQSASDGACDDGGPGSSYSVCSYATDCDDCGFRPISPTAPPTLPSAANSILCSDACQYAFDGTCDDGGPGSSYSLCEYGADCHDCDERIPLPAPTPAPDGYFCDNTCRYASDGDCDDGGPGSEYSACSFGTDCDDCGPEPPWL